MTRRKKTEIYHMVSIAKGLLPIGHCPFICLASQADPSDAIATVGPGVLGVLSFRKPRRHGLCGHNMPALNLVGHSTIELSFSFN